MKQVFANRCNSFKQECKATTTFHAVKNAENCSILVASHTERIRYLSDSSGRASLKWTVLTISCLMVLGISRFFLVEPQVLLFSLTMVAVFPILQRGDRLGWLSIQN